MNIKVTIRWLISWFVLLACLTSPLNTYPQNQGKIPGGYAVPNPCDPGQTWNGTGHQNSSGSGARNPFGEAFLAGSQTWTLALCNADSDGDGDTNGVELGDPTCSWIEGNTTVMTPVSNPGICEPVGNSSCRAMNTFLTCHNCNALCGTDMTSTDMTSTDMTSTDMTSIDMTSTDIISTDMSSTVMSANDVSSTIMPATDISSTVHVMSANDVSSTIMPANDVSSTSMPANDVSSTIMPANDVSSTIMSANDVSSTIMSANDVSSTIMPANDVSSTIMSANDISSTIMLANDVSSTIMPAIDVSSTIMPAIDVSSTIMPAIDVSSTIMLADELSSTVMPANDVSSTEMSANGVIYTAMASTDMTPPAIDTLSVSGSTSTTDAMTSMTAVTMSSTDMTATTANETTANTTMTSGSMATDSTVSMAAVLGYTGNETSATMMTDSTAAIADMASTASMASMASTASTTTTASINAATDPTITADTATMSSTPAPTTTTTVESPTITTTTPSPTETTMTPETTTTPVPTTTTPAPTTTATPAPTTTPDMSTITTTTPATTADLETTTTTTTTTTTAGATTTTPIAARAPDPLELLCVSVSADPHACDAASLAIFQAVVDNTNFGALNRTELENVVAMLENLSPDAYSALKLALGDFLATATITCAEHAPVCRFMSTAKINALSLVDVECFLNDNNCLDDIDQSDPAIAKAWISRLVDVLLDWRTTTNATNPDYLTKISTYFAYSDLVKLIDYANGHAIFNATVNATSYNAADRDQFQTVTDRLPYAIANLLKKAFSPSVFIKVLADFKNELSSISSNELKAIPADFATSLNNSERETVMTAFSSVNTGKVSGFVASIANANSNIKLTSRFLLPDINQSVMVKNLDATHLGFSPFQTGLYQLVSDPDTDWTTSSLASVFKSGAMTMSLVNKVFSATSTTFLCHDDLQLIFGDLGAERTMLQRQYEICSSDWEITTIDPAFYQFLTNTQQATLTDVNSICQANLGAEKLVTIAEDLDRNWPMLGETEIVAFNCLLPFMPVASLDQINATYHIIYCKNAVMVNVPADSQEHMFTTQIEFCFRQDLGASLNVLSLSEGSGLSMMSFVSATDLTGNYAESDIVGAIPRLQALVAVCATRESLNILAVSNNLPLGEKGTLADLDASPEDSATCSAKAFLFESYKFQFTVAEIIQRPNGETECLAETSVKRGLIRATYNSCSASNASKRRRRKRNANGSSVTTCDEIRELDPMAEIIVTSIADMPEDEFIQCLDIWLNLEFSLEVSQQIIAKLETFLTVLVENFQLEDLQMIQPALKGLTSEQITSYQVTRLEEMVILTQIYSQFLDTQTSEKTAVVLKAKAYKPVENWNTIDLIYMVDVVSGLSNTEIASLNPDTVLGSFEYATASCLQMPDDAQKVAWANLITASNILGSDSINWVGSNIAALGCAIGGLDTTTLAGIPVASIVYIDEDALSNIPAPVFSGFTAAQINGFTDNQIRAITTAQIQALPQAAYDAMLVRRTAAGLSNDAVTTADPNSGVGITEASGMLLFTAVLATFMQI